MQSETSSGSGQLYPIHTNRRLAFDIMRSGHNISLTSVTFESAEFLLEIALWFTLSYSGTWVLSLLQIRSLSPHRTSSKVGYSDIRRGPFLCAQIYLTLPILQEELILQYRQCY